MADVLPKPTGINKHTNELVENKQSPYIPIHS